MTHKQIRQRFIDKAFEDTLLSSALYILEGDVACPFVYTDKEVTYECTDYFKTSEIEEITNILKTATIDDTFSYDNKLVNSSTKSIKKMILSSKSDFVLV